jgi:hypothetical protein
MKMIAAVQSQGLIPWVALTRPEGARILRKLLAKWEAILGNKSNREEVYQQFIAENAGLFFGHKSVVISKVPMGADHVTDFVIARDAASYGFAYEFVELESPHTPAYTRKGHPSARLTMAVQQVTNWKRWLDANRGEAKKIFPSKPFKLYDSPTFAFTIYIGRSDNLDESLARRNQYASDLNVSIHGFDHLTRRLREPEVGVFPLIFSSEMDSIQPDIRNELANPFTSAYSWGDWREIVKSPKFSDDHMIANNWEILLKHRIHSRAHEKFLALLSRLPAEQKKFYSSILQRWERV